MYKLLIISALTVFIFTGCAEKECPEPPKPAKLMKYSLDTDLSVKYYRLGLVDKSAEDVGRKVQKAFGKEKVVILKSEDYTEVVKELIYRKSLVDKHNTQIDLYNRRYNIE